MPKPLGQQPDTKPIHEQVRELMRLAHIDRMAPIGIKFSDEGYSLAQSQNVPGMRAFTGPAGAHVATGYLGYPFEVVRGQAEEVVLVLVPGGSEEAKQFRASQGLRSVNRTFERQPDPIRVTAKGPLDRPTIDVLAEGLTKPQLCDHIMAWVKANPADQLGLCLRDAVIKNGRFE